MPRVIMHMDMDAFYASVEQRDHPEYRGKPLIVGSPPDKRGVVCAASYEARKFKVRSAMPSSIAGRLCPEGIFVRPRMDVYRAESVRIMAILQEFTPLIEQVSVDEAYLDVSALAYERLPLDDAIESMRPIAEEIKARIQNECQLTASVGVSSNKFLAKLASDFQKPNGLTLIFDREKLAFLRPLPVGTIHGVGPVTAKSLEALGLMTIGDIQDTKMSLESVAGSFASKLKERALGIDDRPIDLSEERKSISAENTFLVDTDHRPELRAALKEMAVDVAETLAKHDLGALTVQVKVRYSDFTTLTRQIRLDDPVTAESEIYRTACFLLARHRLVTGPLRLLGIGVSTLAPPSVSNKQLRLPL